VNTYTYYHYDPICIQSSPTEKATSPPVFFFWFFVVNNRQIGEVVKKPVDDTVILTQVRIKQVRMTGETTQVRKFWNLTLLSEKSQSFSPVM